MSYDREESCFSGDNTLFIEGVFRGYEEGETEIPDGWKDLFTGLPASNGVAGAATSSAAAHGAGLFATSDNTLHVLNFFRSYGHLSADLDPLGLVQGVEPNHEKYLASMMGSKGQQWMRSGVSLSSIVKELKKIYCGKIGFEFMHISSDEERYWIQDRIENVSKAASPEDKKEMLRHLQETELFEQFLHTRYPGYKRFSIEGGDSFIVSLERIIAHAPKFGVKEIVLGMAHRGRLNVLTKVMRKPYAAVMHEFSGGMAYPKMSAEISGDVKYHLGYSHDREVEGGSVHLSLACNSSSLESVNSIVMGRVKARSDYAGHSVLGVLVHGDASFIGQGVVAEGFTLSGVEGYSPQGIVHIVINNQVGFTANPKETKTSTYCSDIAKMVDAPIFHVNGDDPESVSLVTDLAVEYREKFKKDVVIDIVCYRRYGHNEGDEPSFTQPLMYKCISTRKTVANLYAEKLIAEGVITEAEFNKLRDGFRKQLDEAFTESSRYEPAEADWFKGAWKDLRYHAPGQFSDYISKTGVPASKLRSLAKALFTVPEGFSVDTKISKIMEMRHKSLEGDSIDWGTGEALAFASLLAEEFRVRLSGEDCARGTFSHRHARLVDQATGEYYTPLNNLGVTQAKFEIMNSPLSEYAVMGFEYGYSLDSPSTLVMWEAQFGDFANGAQIIIDQYIAAAETKWLRSSGLVLLLPHGYEGQGPEHTSARLERFLQLCAVDNMQVVNCTTPANYFHVLRRQLHRDFRKPLVILTPKSLLRHKMAVSKLSDFEGGFAPVIGEVSKEVSGSKKVSKIVICSGKIYYDLLEARADRGDVALLRLEQYYPFPTELLANELKKYEGAQVIWCQEEHFNMGGWSFVRDRIEESMRNAGTAGSVSYVGRPESASTATGYTSTHIVEQQAVIRSIFG
ncbi:MAG: 2-oxoglutarate dehydrogenase E1 component [Anaplasma sp.]